MSAKTYTEVGGVEWCVIHQGIVDEIGPGDGEHCDLTDRETCPECDGGGLIGDTDETFEDCPLCDGHGTRLADCDIRTLYVEGDKS